MNYTCQSNEQNIIPEQRGPRISFVTLVCITLNEIKNYEVPYVN